TLLFFFLLVGLSTTTLLTPDQMMEKYWGFDWDVIVAYRDKSEYEKFHNEVDKIVRDETKVDDSYVVYQYMINGLDQNIGIFALEEEYIDRMISLIDGSIPRAADELAIGKILADANNLKIGDEIELSYGEQKAKYKISGLFQTINNIGRCVTFTTPALERLMGEAYADDFTQIYYVLEDQSVCDAVVEKVNEAYPDLNIISVIETWKSYGMMSDAFNILPVIIFGFAVVFIIISSLQLAEKVFNREQIDFGIMKAVGFRNGVSRQIFSLRFVIVSVVGLILGAVVFHFVAGPLLNTLVGFMGLSQVPVQVPVAQVLISALAMSLIFWLVAYFTSRKIKRLKVRDLVTGT
ncbi:MAG: ABC transporter permease, partial [Clostridiaceae bacterium]|nr:ABC transporter permease [Clostridiaceae bacterium]